jgi:hypothetical protein
LSGDDVKPADADGELRPFLSPKAANEWAQTGAYQECGADICEIYTVDGASKEEAIEKVRTGQAGKPSRVHRRLTAGEIEGQERHDAIMLLKELGL